MGTNGTMMSALLYIPKGVTAKNPCSSDISPFTAISIPEKPRTFSPLNSPGAAMSSWPLTRPAMVFPMLLRSSMALAARTAYVIFAHWTSSIPRISALKAIQWADMRLYALPQDIPTTINRRSYWAPPLVRYGTAEGTAELPHNLRLIYSQHDEFAKFMYGVDMPKDIVNTAKLKKLFGTTDAVQVEKEMYGSLEAGNARQLLMPYNMHTRDHF